MTVDKDKLAALRREIDRIDESIHDLIIERTKVVEKVRNAKRGEKIKIRPAREAEILYRLMKRHRGHFPKRELARIWREIIVATLRFEGPFSVAVYVGDNGAGYSDMARDQYGSFTPMSRHVSTRAVVEAVRDMRATVGILPLPRRDDEDHWWRLLVSETPNTPRVIARLPFIGGAAGADIEALVICPIDQEQTGRDRSYLAVEADADIGFKAVEQALSQAGVSAVSHQVWHGSERPAVWTYLTEVFGFVDTKGRQLDRLKDSLGRRAKRLVHLGGYATPLSDADLADPEPLDGSTGS
ncbi:MAG: chorismate mutase [Rhodospirillales bacterium]|nr:chorismate mutase [Rhodospirillales bacterium]